MVVYAAFNSISSRKNITLTTEGKTHKKTFSALIITFMTLNIICWNVMGIMFPGYALPTLLDQNDIDEINVPTQNTE